MYSIDLKNTKKNFKKFCYKVFEEPGKNEVFQLGK